MKIKITRVIAFAMLMLLNAFVYAQDVENAKTSKHEIGIDGTLLIDRLLFNSDNNNGIENNYFFNYKYHMKKYSLRFRLGGLNNISKDLAEDFYSESGRKSSTQRVNMTLGIEKRKSLGKKWSYNYGLEALFDFGRSVNTTSQMFGENPERINLYTNYGGNLIAGIKYSITPWLSIRSEASLQFAFARNTLSYKFINEENDRKTTRKLTRTRFIPTNGMIISIHF